MFGYYTDKKGLTALLSIVDDANMHIHVIQRYADTEPDEVEVTIPLAPIVEPILQGATPMLIPLDQITFISELEKLLIQKKAIDIITQYIELITE